MHVVLEFRVNTRYWDIYSVQTHTFFLPQYMQYIFITYHDVWEITSSIKYLTNNLISWQSSCNYLKVSVVTSWAKHSAQYTYQRKVRFLTLGGTLSLWKQEGNNKHVTQCRQENKLHASTKMWYIQTLWMAFKICALKPWVHYTVRHATDKNSLLTSSQILITKFGTNCHLLKLSSGSIYVVAF